MIGLLLNPWAWLAAAGLAAGIWLHGYSSNNEAEKVQAAWDHAEQLAQAARTKQVERLRINQAELQREADQERRKFDEKQNAGRAELYAELDRLRHRAARGDRQQAAAAAPAPGAATQAGGCTGAELYQDDAVFLTRWASLAQGIREQRDLCYSQYGAAQRRLRELGGDAQGQPRPGE